MTTPFTIGYKAIMTSGTIPVTVTITAVHPVEQMHLLHGYRTDWNDADYIYEASYATPTTQWTGLLIPDTQLEPS